MKSSSFPRRTFRVWLGCSCFFICVIIGLKGEVIFDTYPDEPWETAGGPAPGRTYDGVTSVAFQFQPDPRYAEWRLMELTIDIAIYTGSIYGYDARISMVEDENGMPAGATLWSERRSGGDFPIQSEADHKIVFPIDEGGPGAGYYDTTAGNAAGSSLRTGDVDVVETDEALGGAFVGYMVAGEWLQYTIDAEAEALYWVELSYAAIHDGGKIHLELDGKQIGGQMALARTGGWRQWRLSGATYFSLSKGEHTLRVVLDAPGPWGDEFIMNLDYLAVTVHSRLEHFAGSATRGHRDGPPGIGQTTAVSHMTLRPDDVLYFVDGDRVRKLGPDGSILTLAIADSLPSGTPINLYDLAVDSQENIYLVWAPAEYDLLHNRRLLEIKADGTQQIIPLGYFHGRYPEPGLEIITTVAVNETDEVYFAGHTLDLYSGKLVEHWVFRLDASGPVLIDEEDPEWIVSGPSELTRPDLVGKSARTVAFLRDSFLTRTFAALITEHRPNSPASSKPNILTRDLKG